jgi:DNA mismatch repair protein MutS2
VARPPDELAENPAADARSSEAAVRSAPWRDLEWPELLEVLARRAVSELGGRRLLALEPAPDEAEAQARAALSAQALQLARAGARLPAFDVPDVTRAVERVRRGAVADAGELGHVRRVLAAGLELARFFGEHGEVAPELEQHLAVEPRLARLRDDIQHCIDDDGTVADRASPELSRARRQVAQLRQQVRARLGELIHRYREALQDAYFAERDGRYVLPVRADAPFRVEGMVLGSSASGATLYIEPRELAELGNRLKMAEAEAEHEAARVLSRLSEELGPQVDATLGALEACARADALHAIVDFAETTRAHVLEWGEPGSLALVAMRHPLLAARGVDVVANDLPLGQGRGLVLSGPNAGGKTVALKCLGLAALMQASGLPIPAAPGSRVGFFDTVHSDIGDDQSLARSLSTFSGHIERVRDILSLAGPGVLVLLDELAGGTDPEEGAALAVAVLEELVRRGAAVAVTTHYERLKDLGHESEVIDNAAVGFDFERLEPTFRLKLGTPGASSALAVARRHGLSERVVERARGIIPEISQRREALLHELERQRIELETLRREALFEKDLQAELRRRLEDERRKQAERERTELSRAGEELSRAVREARAEVLRVRKGLRDGQGRDDLRQAEKGIDEAARLIALGSELEQRTRAGTSGSKGPLELTVGMRVRLAGMGTVAEVIEAPARGQVRVLAGAMKLSVPVERIEPLTGREARELPQPKKTKAPRRVETPSAAPLAPPKTEDVTLDLRGVRVEEGLSQIDSFIDRLLQRGEFAGYVLHGHGTGAMKSAVRDHLRAHPTVMSSRAAERDEGGDAFTVFWLVG